jgi:hypothetical protein
MMSIEILRLSAAALTGERGRAKGASVKRKKGAYEVTET